MMKGLNILGESDPGKFIHGSLFKLIETIFYYGHHLNVTIDIHTFTHIHNQN